MFLSKRSNGINYLWLEDVKSNRAASTREAPEIALRVFIGYTGDILSIRLAFVK